MRDLGDATRRGKVGEVFQQLRNLVSAARPDEKLPTVRTLARELGVSLATLTLALDQLEADGYVRRRTGSGIYVSDRRVSGSFCILVEPTVMIGGSPFWARLLRHIGGPLSESGTPPQIFCTTPYLNLEDRQLPAEALIPDRVRTLVESGSIKCVLVVSVSPAVVDWIESRGVPVVAYDTPARYSVEMATLEACQLGVEELVRLGCRRIALWSALSRSQHEVFTAVLSSHKLEAVVIPQPQVHEIDQRALLNQPDLINEGYIASLRAFDRPSEVRPDGALCLTATFTLGLLMGLNKLGLTPGKDVQVATPLNRGVSTLRGWETQITRMEFNPEEAGTAMIAAAHRLALGHPVDTNGWERAIRIGESQLVLQIRPKLIPIPA